MTSVRLTSKVDNWDSILGQTRTRVGQIVRKAALDAQAAAQQSAPVDTGALRASIYTVTPGASGYGQSVAAVSAQVKQPPSEQFPEYQVSGAFRAAVVAGIGYGYLIEFGTTRSAAQPFLTPAIEAQQEPFIQALRSALANPAAGANFQVSEGL